MRLTKVIKKEFKSIARDRAFILTLIVEPLILMLVLGYAFQADVRNVETLVIDESLSDYSQKVIDAINNSDYFEHTLVNITLDDAKEELRKSGARAIFYIPPDFDDKLDMAEKAEIELYIDSSDYTIYNILKGASSEVAKDSLQDIVKIIVKDLETERGQKQKEIDEVENLVDSLDELGKRTVENIEKVDIEGAADSIADLKVSLNQLKQAAPALTDSINEIISEVDSVESDLRANKKIIRDIDTSADEMEDTYKDIQDKMRTVNLELKKLKKDFLSFPFDIKKDYLFGEISYFNYLTPAIMTLILFFIGFVLTSLNLVEERNSKTLFRISTTPLKKYELFGGKFFVYLFVGVLETLYVLFIALVLFNVTVVGSIFSVMLVLLLLMATAIGLGLLISSIVKTMRQASLLLPLIVIPLLLVSQTFSPIEVMPKFMRPVAYISPMFYSNIALRGIMIKGLGLGDVIIPVIVLALYALLAVGLGIVISKKRIT